MVRLQGRIASTRRSGDDLPERGGLVLVCGKSEPLIEPRQCSKPSPPVRRLSE